MSIKVGDFVKHDRLWYQYNAASKDDCGYAKVIGIAEDRTWAVLEESFYNYRILFPENVDQLEPLRMNVVTIPKEEYIQLEKVSRHMELLEEAGVDNWEGYVGPEDDEEDEDEDEDE